LTPEPAGQNTATTPVTVELDTAVYDLDCAQRAAATLTRLGTFNFALNSERQLTVTVLSRQPQVKTSRELADLLLIELLDQKLRARISEETKTERDLVLAYAFSNTKLLG
jgi:His-Xaa-Ser system protein HxsD